MAIEYSELESEYEALGDSEAMELSEARRRPAPRPSTGQSTYRPRPQTGQYVTQAQLQTALERVAGQIRANSTAIRDASSRVAAAENTLRREIAARSKTVDQNKRDIQQVATISALLPLLTQAPTVNVTENILGPGGVGDVIIPAGTQLLKDTPGTDLKDLLPLLFLTGVGGGGGSAPGAGGMDSTLLLVVAMLAVGGSLGGARN